MSAGADFAGTEPMPLSDPSFRPAVETRAPQSAWWRRERWRLALLCFGVGVVYAATAMFFGFEMRLAGWDVTLVAAGFLELSFGVLGYGLGLTRELRRAEVSASTKVADGLERLAAMQGRLAQAEKLASLGQLAGTMAHEVRNPLAVIRTMVQNLKEETAEPDTARTCGEVLEEVDRLARVTARLVDFAKPLQVEARPLRLTELRDQVLPLAEMLAGAAGAVPVWDAGDVENLQGDRDLLCQGILGLVDNAASVSPAGGEIRLRWRRRDDGVVLQVMDQGPGIDDDLRERIFEPFFTTRSQGHGLGLAVIRQIAVAHGGDVRVLDPGPDPGDPGATFEWRLPAGAPAGGEHG